MMNFVLLVKMMFMVYMFNIGKNDTLIYFLDRNIEIFQMSTTSDAYDNKNLEPEYHVISNKVIYSGTTVFYMIRRDIAKRIVDSYMLEDGSFDFSKVKTTVLLII